MPGGACPPLVVGLSAPQGCGKTTLVTQLTKLLESDGVRAASVSIDDVYLTGEEQERVAMEAVRGEVARVAARAAVARVVVTGVVVGEVAVVMYYPLSKMLSLCERILPKSEIMTTNELLIY